MVQLETTNQAVQMYRTQALQSKREQDNRNDHIKHLESKVKQLEVCHF